MDVSRIRTLRGPNLWSRHTAIQAIVRCDGAETAIADLPGFEARLRERFPELGDLIPSDHLDTVSVAHALEFCALGLQAQAGCPVTFSRTAPTLEKGVFQVVVEYTEEKVGRLAFDLAIALLEAAADDKLFETEDGRKALALMEHITERFPQISSQLYVNNTKGNDTIGDLPLRNFHGTDFIYELMEDLRFKVGPKSFYQTNTEQAYHLYEVARRFACLTGEELVYDLYTGTGTIANFCAARCARVVGVEYVPEAIADAKVNSELNGIENTVFYAGDMKAVLDDGFVAANGRPDVIILDPPRAGVDEPVIEVILRAAPERIVYVSCNPATQARDLQLMDAAYRVEAVQPVDMFPHTHHVENVVKLVRR